MTEYPENDDFIKFPNALIKEIKEPIENNYFSPVISDVSEIIDAPKTIADIGCGNGVFSVSMKQIFECTLTGIDGNSYALRKAKENGFDKTFQVNDFSNDELPLSPKSMDLVICKDVLEHLINPKHLASEIAKSVKPNGHALIHVPNQLNLIGRIRLLFSNDIDTFNYFQGYNRWDYPHIRFYTKASIIDLFGLFGFEPFYDLSGHFASPARFKTFPFGGLMRYLAERYTDTFSEGITILFRKV